MMISLKFNFVFVDEFETILIEDFIFAVPIIVNFVSLYYFNSNAVLTVDA